MPAQEILPESFLPVQIQPIPETAEVDIDSTRNADTGRTTVAFNRSTRSADIDDQSDLQDSATDDEVTIPRPPLDIDNSQRDPGLRAATPEVTPIVLKWPTMAKDIPGELIEYQNKPVLTTTEELYVLQYLYYKHDSKILINVRRYHPRASHYPYRMFQMVAAIGKLVADYQVPQQIALPAGDGTSIRLSKKAMKLVLSVFVQRSTKFQSDCLKLYQGMKDKTVVESAPEEIRAIIARVLNDEPPTQVEKEEPVTGIQYVWEKVIGSEQGRKSRSKKGGSLVFCRLCTISTY